MIHKIIDELKEMLRDYQTLKNIDIQIHGFDHKYDIIFVHRIVNIMHMVALESTLYKIRSIYVRITNGVPGSTFVTVLLISDYM
jgi:hypothetical protein